jgi:hypothetical protein
MVQASVYESLLARFESGEADVLPVLVDALLEGVDGQGGHFGQVMTRATKRGGVVRPSEPVKNSYALVVPGKSITLIGTKTESKSTRGVDGRYTHEIVEVPYVKTYRIGDLAEHSSWNLSYYGEIKAIGAKTVTIDKGHREGTARLDLEVFAMRNSRFDAEKAWKHNSEWMD